MRLQFYAFGQYGINHDTFGPNEELMAKLDLNYKIMYDAQYFSRRPP